MQRRFDAGELRRLKGESDAPPALDGDDPLIGALVADRFRVVRQLGVGSQAVVYVARHTLIKRLVALKVLAASMSSDQELVRRFLDEGQVAGTMGHPNIVESLDMGVTDDGRPYLVLELLEGTTLEVEREKGVFDVGRAAYIMVQVASALAAAHERGIVHRDLKPENVFLIERNGRIDHVKVIDFGVSKLMARREDAQAGLVVGTPDYMAPEQVTSPANVDARADIYAVGTMLYELLGGALPTSGAGDVDSILRAIVTRVPEPLAQVRPGLPPGLVAIVERAMQKDPAKRFGIMSELEDALAPFAVAPPLKPNARPSVPDFPVGVRLEGERLSGVGLIAGSVTPPAGSLVEPVASTAQPVASTTQPVAPNRSPLLVAAALLLGTAVVGALAWGARGTARTTTAQPTPVTLPEPKRETTATPAAAVTVETPTATVMVATPTATGPAVRTTVTARGALAKPALVAATTTVSPAVTPSVAAPEATSVAPPPVVPPPPVASATAPVAPVTATPTEAPAATAAPGTIPPKGIAQTVRAHKAAVQDCFDRARMHNSELRGRVTVRASTDPAGSVTGASVASTTANDTRLESCLLGSFRTWTFPAPAGGVPGSVQYTFVFE